MLMFADKRTLRILKQAQRAIHRKSPNAKLVKQEGGKREYLEVHLKKPRAMICFTRLKGKKNWQFDHGVED
jgi:hypothetical protein